METRHWLAVLREMLGKPDDFHVKGEVRVPNSGVEALLTFKGPHLINPEMLLLDLNLIQQAGRWPQMSRWIPASYDSIIYSNTIAYKHVEVFYENARVAFMDVKNVS